MLFNLERTAVNRLPSLIIKIAQVAWRVAR